MAASQFFVGKKEDIENSAKEAKMESEQVKLDIIVVGAGIAGLGAAITLSRAGHNVTVLEKSQFKKEAGFMITLGSNAIRVLNSFDFDYVRSRPVDCKAIETSDGHTLELSNTNVMNDYKVDETLQPRTFYRPDLHDELKRLALLVSPNFPTPILRLGAEVVDVDIGTATVTLKDGTTFSGDLLIAADGERSRVKAEFKDGQSLRQAPYKIYRAIVPTERLSVEEGDRAMLAMTSNKFAIFQSLDRTLSWFQGRDGLLQDLEAGYLVHEGEDMKAETDPQVAYEKMMEKFADFHPDIVNALRKAERVSDWEVNYSRPLPYLHKKKAVLIGDAAHSMFPTTGQGGSQGMEDIGALGILLSSLGSKSELESRLKLFEEIRKERVTVVQALSRVVFGTEEDFATPRPWHIINKAELATTEKHMKFLFEYDVLAAATKALEQKTNAKANL